MKTTSTAITLILGLLCLLPLQTLAQQCTHAPQLDIDAPGWDGWGNGAHNRRSAVGGIDAADLPTLALRWAFAFPGAGSAIGNPVIHGDMLFTGSEDGTVYALDAASGCIHWRYAAGDGVRTAPALARIDDRWLLLFGDRGATVHALDALDGTPRWRQQVDAHPAAILTGAPLLVSLPGASPAQRLLVPVSSSEEGLAAVPGYECCSFQGSVVSLDAGTGEILWQRHPIQQPVRETGSNSRGPSGAAIWSAPTADPARGQLFVTTGDAYSAPADIATDAVMGLDLASGRIAWINPGTTGDIWTVRCLGGDAPDDCGPDQDFGSPAMLLGEGDDRFLVAGQKSGVVRAYTPDSGTRLWRTVLVDNPDEFGGKIIWGGASDGDSVYFGLGTGGLYALAAADGALRWFNPLPPPADRANRPGRDGPLTVSEDLVLTGGWDGVLHILSAATGASLWSFDTVRDFEAVNNVAARGGSMGAVGPVVAGKRVFVSSGYVGVKNGMRGNVLLMFAP